MFTVEKVVPIFTAHMTLTERNLQLLVPALWAKALMWVTTLTATIIATIVAALIQVVTALTTVATVVLGTAQYSQIVKAWV